MSAGFRSSVATAFNNAVIGGSPLLSDVASDDSQSLHVCGEPPRLKHMYFPCWTRHIQLANIQSKLWEEEALQGFFCQNPVLSPDTQPCTQSYLFPHLSMHHRCSTVHPRARHQPHSGCPSSDAGRASFMCRSAIPRTLLLRTSPDSATPVLL